MGLRLTNQMKCLLIFSVNKKKLTIFDIKTKRNE
jgi:hypothetical protein